MMNTLKIRLVLVAMLMVVCPVWAGYVKTTFKSQKKEAERIIKQFMGENPGLDVVVSIDLEPDKGCDQYSYDMKGGKLHVHASSGVAACRGFYDFVKSNEAGICSWTGNRFALPEELTRTEQEPTVSPYRDHQYLNVVTYGYTTPYWDEERWDREIDWMALHGVDMPLMLVAAEAIYRRVFTTEPFNLQQSEVDAWEVGPAHLPWFRMGNLGGNSFDGPLGDHWNQRQIALAHHILDRMRRLGMKPVCPAFGGFVPQALAQQYPGDFSATGWNWVPKAYRNYRLNPNTDAFVTVGTRFIQEWEKEFGECGYYLSDSFNEMTVPDDTDLLTLYGDNVFKCINEGSRNPDAVWVTQGWTFVYQAGEWGKDKFNALTRNVPKHRFNLLYMSPEYGNGEWEKPYEGFNNHDWTITMLPNMGGKNFYNGGLDDYAKAWRTQYNNYCENLTGWGMTPEGVENNEMVYELICDAGWTSPSIPMDVDQWKRQYACARYGCSNPDILKFQDMLHSTVLARYQDHKCFGWQGYNKTNGYVNGSIDPGNDFYQGMEEFLSPENLKQYAKSCPQLLRLDIVEAAAFYVGCRIEKLNKRIKAAHSAGKGEEAHALLQDLRQLLTQMDRLLTAHPLYDEQKWEDKAVRMAEGNKQGTVGAAPKESVRYARNARRIVSLWYGDHSAEPNGHEPVNDYACRIWAGLIRDYYMPRLIAEWENILDNAGNNLRDVEIGFIQQERLSPVSSLESASDAELMDYVAKLVALAHDAGNISFEHITAIKVSSDAESHWYAIRSAGANFNLRVLTASADLDGSPVGPLTATEQNGTSSQAWRLLKCGDTYRIENRNGMSMAYNPKTQKPETHRVHVDTDMRMVLHGKTDTDGKSTENTQNCWGLLPSSSDNQNMAFHMNNYYGLMTWNHVVDDLYHEDSSWSIEEVNSIGETYDEDYARYRRRLSGYQKDRYAVPGLIGKLGQPKSACSIATAIAALGNYTAGDHETYDEFLSGKWNTLWAEAITLPGADKPQACKLFDLIVSVFEMKPLDKKEAQDALTLALREAQTALASTDLTEEQASISIAALQKKLREILY